MPTQPLPGQPGFVVPAPQDRPRYDRRAVRVLVLDDTDRMLLFQDSDLGLDPVAHWWVTPGGGVDPGESDLEAGVRELWEETGLVVDASALVGPLLTRVVVHGYSDKVVDQVEVFYVVRVPAFEVDTTAHTEEERLTVADIRWWSLADLATTADDVWPRDVLDVLALASRPDEWRDGPVQALSVEESSVPASEQIGGMDAKATAWGYLRSQRAAVIWKVEGLSERDQRMPLTPTGTNLLGVVKHLAGCEAEYFGLCLGRPWPEPMPFLAVDAEPNADMWATEEESPAEVLDLYRRVTAFADESIEPLGLDAPATVPWWRTTRTDLHTLLVHMAVETARHAGQLDILREQLDGARGLRDGGSNLPDVDTAWWEAYAARLRDIALRSPGGATTDG